MKFYCYAKLGIGLSVALIVFYFYMLRQVNVPQELPKKHEIRQTFKRFVKTTFLQSYILN